MLCAGKKHLARQRPSLPPGGSWQKSALRNRFLTDEECGRQCSDLRNVKTYTEGAVLVVTPLVVCDVVPACRFPPEFLSRPPSGATLPPGEGLGFTTTQKRPPFGGRSFFPVGPPLPGWPFRTGPILRTPGDGCPYGCVPPYSLFSIPKTPTFRWTFVLSCRATPPGVAGPQYEFAEMQR